MAKAGRHQVPLEVYLQLEYSSPEERGMILAGLVEDLKRQSLDKSLALPALDRAKVESLKKSPEELRRALALMTLPGHEDKLRANLEGIDLRDKKLDLDSADLRGAKLSDAHLQSTRLAGAELREAKMDRTDLEGATLDGANFQGATMAGVRLEYAQLRQDSIENTAFQDATLDSAKLKGANLRNVNLQGAS